MTTMERLEKVEVHLARKVAAFIDRDGVINEEIDFITKKEQLRLIKRAAEGIRMLNEAGILAIVVTNQPVVARNLITEEKLDELHSELRGMLLKEGAKLNAIYYCPHHPEKNHPEANNPKYRRECSCRKPNAGMIDEAAKTFKIDVGSSYVVGDRSVDVQLGKNAGCTTILVKTGYGGKDGKYDAKADYECGSLLEACKLIIQLYRQKSSAGKKAQKK